MGRIRLTERQWRIYLAVWVVTLASLAGILAGMLIPGLLARPAPAKLVGDFVVNPPVMAPSFSLVDQRGNPFSLSSEHGQVVALTFLDTQCQSLCPLQAALLGSVQSELAKSAPLTVVVVSVRPDVDTPSAISAFAGAHGMTGAYYWLKGPQPELETVWANYGISVQPGSGDLAHSSVIYLIDRRGYERVMFGDVPDPGWLVNDVRLLQRT
jgi:protein SCO1/2